MQFVRVQQSGSLLPQGQNRHSHGCSQPKRDFLENLLQGANRSVLLVLLVLPALLILKVLLVLQVLLVPLVLAVPSSHY